MGLKDMKLIEKEKVSTKVNIVAEEVIDVKNRNDVLRNFTEEMDNILESIEIKLHGICKILELKEVLYDKD